MSDRALAREIGVSLPTVQRWLDRYREEGLSELEEGSRSGRPPSRITPELEAEIVRRRLREKPPLRTPWSTRLMAERMGLHHGKVQRLGGLRAEAPQDPLTSSSPPVPASSRSSAMSWGST